VIYLFDTNMISDLMRNQEKVRERYSSIQSTDRVFTSAIVFGEVYFGLRRLPQGKRREVLFLQAEAVFANLVIQPISKEIAGVFAEVKCACEQVGIGVENNDCWIAATARSLQATLVSRDTDMLRVPGLTVVDWSA